MGSNPTPGAINLILVKKGSGFGLSLCIRKLANTLGLRSQDPDAYLSVSLWPVVLVAFPAVDWAALCGLERDFTFLAAVGAHGLVHLSGAAVEATPSFITHFSHSFYTDILKIL